HVQRLFQSASLVGIQIAQSQVEVAQIIVEFVARNQPQSDVYIRPYAYKSGLDLPPGLAGVENGLAIYAANLGRLHDRAKQGLSVKISSWRRIEDNAIPARGKISGAYINSSLAKDEAV